MFINKNKALERSDNFHGNRIGLGPMNENVLLCDYHIAVLFW